MQSQTIQYDNGPRAGWVSPERNAVKLQKKFSEFYVQWSMHRVICVNNCPTRCNNIQFIYICKLLYMFQVVAPSVIRSSHHCIYSIWHYWDNYCYLSWTSLHVSGVISTHHQELISLHLEYLALLRPLLLPVVNVTGSSRQVAVMVSVMPDTVDTVIWAPDDGWRYHPKHVEQFADINKLYIVASFWTIIDRRISVVRDLNFPQRWCYRWLFGGEKKRNATIV